MKPAKKTSFENKAFLAALQNIEGLGPVRLTKLLSFFDRPGNLWLAQYGELRSLGLNEKLAANLVAARKKTDPLKQLEQILEKGIRVVSIYDEDYPYGLKHIHTPPVVLYYRGELPGVKRAIGVVGARKISAYGRIVTQKLTAELAGEGFVIISGLARGVDTVAHRTALEYKGQTVAVLGGGLNAIFPSENEGLVEAIVSGQGAVISEYSPDFPALPGNFPARNRIIAGLSEGVLVTEAAEDSGSLITAHQALELGKEVFAVPGPITSQFSRGTAVLIRQGAKLVMDAADIFEELGYDLKTRNGRKTGELESLSKTERDILTMISGEVRHIDQIVRESGKSAAEISGVLIKMEIAGFIRNTGGGNYIKSF